MPSRSRFIAAAPDEVFATLAAFDQISRWAKNVDHAAYTTTITEGLGATRRVQSGRVTVLETITEWAPPTRMAYSISGLPKIAGQVTNRWELAKVAGGTQATMTTTIEAGSNLLGRLVAAVLGRVLGRVSDQLLDGLAAYHATGGGSAKRA
jgi:uncharacterized protein YndB with AHSA1/START domain